MAFRHGCPNTGKSGASYRCRQNQPGKGPKTPATGVTGGSVGSLSEGYAANESQDLDSAC